MSAIVRAARGPRAFEGYGRTVILPQDVLDRLDPHALRRRMHVTELVRLLVQAIALGELVDAVLDDEKIGGAG